ncbi:bacteriohemerythrin [Geothrix sp. PMB-07]|uniref:bacteriohemerythrin n=1 Tax=Geothrix sp. PMB-07 TaxID=3068640 RepID=UPI0027424EB2|nr:bacteriohemerythrin [Geothrix sp. PMB-07]WLT30466.1 bacteriohemerythrin [Geothrix sp. PMB-07]
MEVAWSSRYDTGIRVIDEQHQELFQLLERLRKVVQEDGSGAAMEALLAELVACSERHFATEEAYMARFNYPDLGQHVSEHATMLTSLHELLTKFRENQQVMALMVPTFMEGWLKHHISDGDFGFVTFLKARNLT